MTIWQLSAKISHNGLSIKNFSCLILVIRKKARNEAWEVGPKAHASVTLGPLWAAGVDQSSSRQVGKMTKFNMRKPWLEKASARVPDDLSSTPAVKKIAKTIKLPHFLGQIQRQALLPFRDKCQPSKLPHRSRTRQGLGQPKIISKDNKYRTFGLTNLLFRD